jgi:hypothetical protein
MSSVNFIPTTQPSVSVSAGKSTAQQSVTTSQSQPSANSSSATISQAARDALAATIASATEQSSSVTAAQSTAPQTVTSAQSQPTANTSGSAIPANSEPSFKQAMAEKFAGNNTERSMIQNDPSNPIWTQGVDSMAQHDFTAGTDVLYDLSHTMTGASGNPTIDGILRYSSGEPVTAESRAYVTKQTADYQNQLREMISSEKAKGTASSDIMLKIMDQQGQQPTRFRTYMAWPIASDFASTPPSATSGAVKPS